MKIAKNAIITLLTAAMSVTAFTALADDDKWESKRSVKISPAQAADIAKAKVIGEVIDLDLEFDDGRPYYDIEVQGKRTKHEVRVDANSGKILISRIDDDDRDDDDDDDD
ncbi:MAG: PepSY domain-containing protein [Alcaligenaceae bacterium]|nr:PepSY domain-containing protein [Alcaligenaceae bacterium]